MSFPTIAIAFTVGAVVALVLLGLRRRFVFEIRVDGPGVTVHGAVPGHSTSDVAAFVAGLGLPRGARIQAVPDGDRFCLVFSPQVPAAEHQRLRNYLYNRS